MVSVFDPDGSLRASFFAFDPNFRGGVRVATGDVTGDGVSELIVGTGPGGGPHVRIFDGVTGARLTSFSPYSESFTGGIFVAGGDVTGDGLSDVIVGPAAGHAPLVQVFDGATGERTASFLAYDPGLHRRGFGSESKM